MKYVTLHYSVTSSRRYYGGKTCEIRKTVTSTREKFNRETFLPLDSHVGTHIDYPAHVVEGGLYGESYPFDYLFSEKVSIVEIDCRNGEDVTLKRLEQGGGGAVTDCEILLIKTGFCEVRDLDCYWGNSPIIDAEIPFYLKKNFPTLKAVGFDVISLTSQKDKREGRACHCNFLNTNGGREILVIEDVDMRKISILNRPEKIFIIPFLYEYMDGSFCTILAEINTGE